MNLIPKIQKIGLKHGPLISAAIGFIKANKRGNKIFVSKLYEYDEWGNKIRINGSLEGFKFNNKTGTLSDGILIEDSLADSYGIEFSPSDQFLYNVVNPNDSNKYYLWQYDITNWNKTDIVNSKFVYSSDILHSNFGGLQIGPDGKIYIPSAWKWISVIHQPDKKGDSADLRIYELTPNDYSGFGVPTFPNDTYSQGGGLSLEGPVAICIGDTTSYKATGGCDDTQYAFETGPGIRRVAGSADELQIIAQDTGRVWIAVRRADACAARNDTLWIDAKICSEKCKLSYQITESHTRVCRVSRHILN